MDRILMNWIAEKLLSNKFSYENTKLQKLKQKFYVNKFVTCEVHQRTLIYKLPFSAICCTAACNSS